MPKHNFETKLLRRKTVCALFKMATGNARKRVRFTLDVTFPTAQASVSSKTNARSGRNDTSRGH